MKVSASFRKLFIDMLKDLYSAEKQLIEALPKMAQAAHSKNLKQIFFDHLEETKGQAQRLRTILDDLNATEENKCEAMENLIKWGEEIIKNPELEPAVKDAGLIVTAKKIEHYEIAGYGTVRYYAELLGMNEAVGALELAFEQEDEADESLDDLVKSEINLKALEVNVKAHGRKHLDFDDEDMLKNNLRNSSDRLKKPGAIGMHSKKR